MGYSERFAEAMEGHRPSCIRLLFLAEAPPAYRVNRFFYFTGLSDGDTLFLEMMKVLYPEEVGFLGGQFEAGFSARRVRERKAELLSRFREDGYFLRDAYEQPMPEGADRAAKMRLMRGTLPGLRHTLRRLAGDGPWPVILIGGVTYSVCAEALRADGLHVVNRAMIDHPARGGQVRFRAKLAEAVRDASRL